MAGSVPTLPRGRSFTRLVIARQLAKQTNADTRLKLIERFGDGHWITRAAVSGLEEGQIAAANARDEFFALITDASIVGRLNGRRDVSFNVRNIAMTSGSRGYWVGEARPIPLSKPALTGESLERRKVAAIVVLTREAMEDPRSEGRVQADLQRAAVAAWDEAFIAADNDGIADTMPPGVTNGISAIVSSGDPAADLRALIENFDGDLSAAYLVSDGKTLAAMSLWRDAAGNSPFPDLGARGGLASGIPALASRSSPRDSSGGQLALIDPTSIAVGLEGMEVTESRSATLLMSDDPESVPATERVSLFQEDAVAMKVVLYSNWSRQRVGAVTLVSGADYAVGS
jgi:HK97 family phage major capsid protein